MKIALVSQEYFPETARGGIGTQTFMKAMGIASLGHEIFIISRSITDKRVEHKYANINEICEPGMENIKFGQVCIRLKIISAFHTKFFRRIFSGQRTLC